MSLEHRELRGLGRGETRGVTAGLDHWALRSSLAFISHRELIGVPCVNSSVLKARGTELAKASGRTRSVGWSILWRPRSGQEEGAFEAGLWKSSRSSLAGRQERVRAKGWGSVVQGSWRLGVRWGAARGQLETEGMVRAQESDRSDRLHWL